MPLAEFVAGLTGGQTWPRRPRKPPLDYRFGDCALDTYPGIKMLEDLPVVFKYHVFTCFQQRPPGHPRGSCMTSGAKPLWDRLASQARRATTSRTSSMTATGCLGFCRAGPLMVVYPQGVWYAPRTPEDIDEIVQSHFIDGNPVETTDYRAAALTLVRRNRHGNARARRGRFRYSRRRPKFGGRQKKAGAFGSGLISRVFDVQQDVQRYRHALPASEKIRRLSDARTRRSTA